MTSKAEYICRINQNNSNTNLLYYILISQSTLCKHTNVILRLIIITGNSLFLSNRLSNVDVCAATVETQLGFFCYVLEGGRRRLQTRGRTLKWVLLCAKLKSTWVHVVVAILFIRQHAEAIPSFSFVSSKDNKYILVGRSLVRLVVWLVD